MKMDGLDASSVDQSSLTQGCVESAECSVARMRAATLQKCMVSGSSLPGVSALSCGTRAAAGDRWTSPSRRV